MIDLNPACDGMVAVLAGVTDGQLGDSTSCASYTVGDLIDHVDQVARGACALARHSPELPDVGAGPDAANLQPGWRSSVSQHVRMLGQVWDDPAAWLGGGGVPGSDLSNETWGRITLTELVVHGWDIARATGVPFDLPESTLRACLDHVTAFVLNAPFPSLWGPPITVPFDASTLDRIVAITGRAP
jgi:uncharacterized protein (TIGR03086 family)